MKIGELAVRTNCPVETIRYYEKEGLIPEPDRTEGNYRDYGPAHVERLSFIRHCRILDMAHDEIRALLKAKDTPAADCSRINVLFDTHIEHVVTRIRELEQLKTQLVELRAKCAATSAIDECGILEGLQELTGSDPAIRFAGSHSQRVH